MIGHLWRIAALGTAAAILLAGGAVAGSGNTIYLTQDNTGGGDGNSIHIDQSAATDSVAGTFEKPVAQNGVANSADVLMDGLKATALLMQDNSAAGSIGNTASITAHGGSTATITQIGDDNTAMLTTDDSTTGTIAQTGDRNIGTLWVTGANNTSSLTQTGHDDQLDVQVTSLNGQGAAVTQSGNGLTGIGGASVANSGSGYSVTTYGTGSAAPVAINVY